ncbi:MAG: 30S ribosomal protein S2 [Bdellovibrionota bacterium]
MAVQMKQLLEAGVHFGHQTRRWNPKMKPYIYGARNGIHIVNLQLTVDLFQKAYDFVANTVARGGKILFVGTKKQAAEVVQQEATRAGMYYVNTRWLGGTLTNFRTISKSIGKLKELQEAETSGLLNKLTKKEGLNLQRHREKLELALGGIQMMTRLPDALFVIDTKKEAIAVAEANRMGVPVVAVVDTNCDPDPIQHVIPGNDDAIRAISLFTNQIAEACVDGGRLQAERLRGQGVDVEGGALPPGGLTHYATYEKDELREEIEAEKTARDKAAADA